MWGSWRAYELLARDAPVNEAYVFGHVGFMGAYSCLMAAGGFSGPDDVGSSPAAYQHLTNPDDIKQRLLHSDVF